MFVSQMTMLSYRRKIRKFYLYLVKYEKMRISLSHVNESSCALKIRELKNHDEVHDDDVC